ncbi:MAG TPA: SEC-C metal-binding domain-containing protein [Gammaproteobacteria bacterium]|nr:SEC-C metal-binding domain-containing protein [Gammaproteobacteria bacterium]
MKPGRNEPCSCGSGKKYKNCCLAAERRRSESPTEVAWARVRRAIEGMPRLLRAFVADVYGPAAVEEAWDEFTLWEGDAFDPDSPLMAIFMPWMYHCWEPWEDTSCVDESLRRRTPTSVLLEGRGGQFDPLLERYLAACLEAPFSFYEILRCDSSHGFRVRDVITGEEHEVLERSASESMSMGDVLFAQLVPIEGIVLLEACSPYALSPVDKIAIIELREDIEDEPPEPELGSLQRIWELEIRELYLQLIGHVLDRRPPVLHNTDGELLKLQRIIFDIDDSERAFAALAQAEGGAADADVERAADGRLERAQFPWTKAGKRLHASWENTVLGYIEISSTRLVAHVNSDERA